MHYFYERLITTTEDYYAIRIRKKGAPKWIEYVDEKMLHPQKRKTIQDIKRNSI